MSATSKPRRRRLPLKRRIAFRVIMLLIVIAAVYGLDAGFGRVMHTDRRHRMSLSPNGKARHRTTEFDYTFATNSLGFRGPEINEAKPTGTRRIAVIGDSFTAGLGVANDGLLTVVLEKLLNKPAAGGPKTQVLNRGRPGSSTIREYDLYRYYTRSFKPDVVVLAFGLGSDMVEILTEQDETESGNWAPAGRSRKIIFAIVPNLYLELAMIKRASRDNRQLDDRTEAEFIAQLRSFAESRGVDAATAEARYRKIPKKYREISRKGLFGNDLKVFYACVEPDRIKKALRPGIPHFEKAWPRVEKHLDLIRDAVHDDGGQLVIMTIPDSVSVDETSLEFNRSLGFELNGEWLTTSSSTETSLRKWCLGKSVPYLDLTGPFRASKEPLYFPMDGHFNVAGQKRAAELLAEFLKSDSVLHGK